LKQPFILLRQFLIRAAYIDYILYRDAWDKYVRKVPKRKLPWPKAPAGSPQDEFYRQMGRY
jgi:hypothetical protein